MSLPTICMVVFGVAALGHIAIQMVFGQLEHRRQARAVYRGDRPSVTVVVPAYNEDPALLHRCLLSIDRQDYPVIDVIVVDDGSRNLDEVLPVHDEFSSGRFRILRRPDNAGKRRAQAVVFEEARTEVVVTIDSDTVLGPNAIRTLVRRFEDPRVGAVTGNVEVINAGYNLLTRLISYRYWTAFNQERAAQSFFGVVACASGRFSAYRRTIIDQVREDYIDQVFLGRPCTFGEDRHLTNLILALGHDVVYDEAAVAKTMVPSTLVRYARQQIRWDKSFYRELCWTLRFAHRRKPYLAFDLAFQTLMPFALLGAVVVTLHEATVDPVGAGWFAGIIATIGLVGVAYGTLRTRSAGFLFFLVYGFLHLFVLIPVRLYALATLRNVDWGTRGPRETDDERDEARRKVVYTRSALGRTEAERAWENDIRDAIEVRDNLTLFWQPVRRLEGGAVTHAEILLRLRHDGQIIPPSGFLTIASEHDLMPLVDRRVVRDAVGLMSDAGENKQLRLEVNISADSMRDPYFPDVLDAHLRQTGIARRNLVLAIPETVAIAEMEATMEFGRRVRALGCLFALDQVAGERPPEVTVDLIRRLPLDYVKFSGDLIRWLPHNADMHARLEHLVTVARARGIETIAVFVGDEETIRVLKDLRVDYGQGFYIGGPAPVAMTLDEIVADAVDKQSVLSA